jgi:phenylalanyl-tRNA synthetase alpha subunit
MVTHVVMWSVKDFADGRVKQENIKLIKKELEGLTREIPQISRLHVGINYNEIPGAMDVVLISHFEDREALQAYQDHPAHIRVRDFIRTVRLEKRSVDFE